MNMLHEMTRVALIIKCVFTRVKVTDLAVILFDLVRFIAE